MTLPINPSIFNNFISSTQQQQNINVESGVTNTSINQFNFSPGVVSSQVSNPFDLNSFFINFKQIFNNFENQFSTIEGILNIIIGYEYYISEIYTLFNFLEGYVLTTLQRVIYTYLPPQILEAFYTYGNINNDSNLYYLFGELLNKDPQILNLLSTVISEYYDRNNLVDNGVRNSIINLLQQYLILNQNIQNFNNQNNQINSISNSIQSQFVNSPNIENLTSFLNTRSALNNNKIALISQQSNSILNEINNIIALQNNNYNNNNNLNTVLGILQNNFNQSVNFSSSVVQ
jgi:hypothetical protein